MAEGIKWDGDPAPAGVAWDDVPAQPVQHGATGSWGLPDLGPINALRTQFHRGLMKDGSDEAVAAAFALGDRHGPGAYLRLPDGTQVAVPTKEDMYRGGRDFIRQEQGAADQHWPKLGFAAQMGGEVLSDYGLAGAGAASRGYQTLSGLARGLMGSDADLTPGRLTPWSAGKAALSTAFGGAVGNLAPVALSRLAKSGPVQYVGGKLEDVAGYAGDTLKNVAGWLKVNSIHPTPALGKKLAALPGGVPGVGKELLERGVGGLTKGQTAAHVERELSAAGGVMDDLATAYDRAGSPPIDVGSAIAEGRKAAEGLTKQPITREAGDALNKILDEYNQLFSGRNVSAAEALEVKRALGKAVYGAKQELNKSGKKLMGDFGEGLAKFERGVDDQLDSALGPRFEQANLAFRRLLGANEATETQAARSTANMLLLGLGNTGAAGVGGLVAGGPGAAAGLAGAALLSKYGSQAGARTLYGLGNALQATPRALFRSPAPYSAASGVAARLRDLLTPERELPSLSLPAWAAPDSGNASGRTLAEATGNWR